MGGVPGTKYFQIGGVCGQIGLHVNIWGPCHENVWEPLVKQHCEIIPNKQLHFRNTPPQKMQQKNKPKVSYNKRTWQHRAEVGLVNDRNRQTEGGHCSNSRPGPFCSRKLSGMMCSRKSFVLPAGDSRRREYKIFWLKKNDPCFWAWFRCLKAPYTHVPRVFSRPSRQYHFTAS